MKFGEQEFESILAFSRNREGQYTGQWISFWGMNELKDVKFEDNKLSFTQVFRFQDQEMTSKFTGTIEEGKLSGLLISDRGEMGIQGKRAPRPPFGISWEMKIQVGENEITGTLMITFDMEGNLSGIWKSSRDESEVRFRSESGLLLPFTALQFARLCHTGFGGSMTQRPHGLRTGLVNQLDLCKLFDERERGGM